MAAREAATTKAGLAAALGVLATAEAAAAAQEDACVAATGARAEALGRLTAVRDKARLMATEYRTLRDQRDAAKEELAITLAATEGAKGRQQAALDRCEPPPPSQ